MPGAELERALPATGRDDVGLRRGGRERLVDSLARVMQFRAVQLYRSCGPKWLGEWFSRSSRRSLPSTNVGRWTNDMMIMAHFRQSNWARWLLFRLTNTSKAPLDANTSGNRLCSVDAWCVLLVQFQPTVCSAWWGSVSRGRCADQPGPHHHGEACV